VRPRFKVLDKTFNTRAKDKTSLRKAQQAKTRAPIEDSEKCYLFKEPVAEEPEEVNIPSVQWDWGDTTATSGDVYIWNGRMYVHSNVTMGATW